MEMTREAAAHRGLLAAHERIRQLEQETELAFTQLDKALERCQEVGLEASLSMSKPVASAWAEHRNRAHRAEAHQVAAEVMALRP